MRSSVISLSFYLLVLNVFSLHHSFKHHADKQIPALHLDYALSVTSADSSDLICKLCDFFQNQVFYFSQEKVVAFTSYPVLLPVEKYTTIELIELFNNHLRGPPALA